MAKNQCATHTGMRFYVQNRSKKCWSNGPWAVVRGPWGGELANSGQRTRSGSLSSQSRSSSQAHKIGATQSAPWSMSRGPWTVFRAHDTRDPASRIMAHAPWITHHGSGARAVVSVAACGSTMVASCDRLRRFLRPGLGPGFSQMGD